MTSFDIKNNLYVNYINSDVIFSPWCTMLK